MSESMNAGRISPIPPAWKTIVRTAEKSKISAYPMISVGRTPAAFPKTFTARYLSKIGVTDADEIRSSGSMGRRMRIRFSPRKASQDR